MIRKKGFRRRSNFFFMPVFIKLSSFTLTIMGLPEFRTVLKCLFIACFLVFFFVVCCMVIYEHRI
ncbi:hypothetical protein V8E55_011468 [Tylopilus felleus]